MIVPRDLAPALRAAAGGFPAVTVTGPRQSGKSTLCRDIFADHLYVSLEALDTRRFALEDPRAFLAGLAGGAIIDEVQRAPELLSYLQGIIDDDPTPGQWILTGSQNFALLASIGQSLAGRTAVHHLLPLAHGEALRFPHHPDTLDEVLLGGGYPAILDRQLSPAAWLASYVTTYIERDVRSISNVGDLATFQRFVELCAGRTAQLLNYSALADDCGISQPTAKKWLGIAEASYLVFRLPPYHRDVRKRLVRMPKLHFLDTGLACWLLGIRTADQLRSVRELGGVRGLQGTAEPRRGTPPELLPQPRRRRGGPGPRRPRRADAARSQSRHHASGATVRRRTSCAEASGGAGAGGRSGHRLWRHGAAVALCRPANSVG